MSVVKVPEYFCLDCWKVHGGYYVRAQKQVDMLAPPAEQDAMFGP